MHLSADLPRDLVTAVRRWPVESQQRARRNAMIASTALAQLRAEREDVEEYLADRRRPAAPDTAAAPHRAPA